MEKGKEELTSEPVKIVAIATGYTHTVGLKSDGTVVAAGLNSKDVVDWGK